MMENSQTASLPASFFQGKDLREGTRCEVEIVSVDGDNVEVAYVPRGTSEGGTDTTEFDSMMEEKMSAREGY